MKNFPASPSALSASALAGMRVVIDARLCELLPTPHDSYDRVGSVMHDGVLAPGKRTRPLLMLLVGRGLANESKPLLDLACALEMVHAASLFLGGIGLVAFLWAMKTRQFDDPEGDANRILTKDWDDHPKP